MAPTTAIVVLLAFCGPVWASGFTSTNVTCCNTADIRAAAMNNNTVYLGPGTFTGSCAPSILFPLQSSWLIGAGRDLTVIDCAGTGGPAVNFSYIGGNVFVGGLTIKNALFSTGAGAAINVAESYVVMQDALFSGNTAGGGDGGAVYVSTNARRVNVTSCIFTHNSGNNGGALSSFFPNAAAGYAIVSNCVFTFNSAYASGGGLYFGMSGEVHNSTFIQNTATVYNGGGATLCCSAQFNFIVTDSVFNLNSAHNTGSANGGGMAIGGNIVLYNTNFTGNSAATTGGGFVLIFADCVASFIGCFFQKNTASGGGGTSGGAICFISTGTPTSGTMGGLSITSSNFTDNLSSSLGGAIYTGGIYFNLTNSYFARNTASGPTTGTNILLAPVPSAETLLIANNTVMSATYPLIDITSGATIISSTIFNNNVVYAVLALGGSQLISFTSCKFSFNNASSVIHTSTGSIQLSVSGSTFVKNLNPYSDGGAIWTAGATTIDGTSFTGNSAAGDGGGIYVYNTAVSISQSTFITNTARNGGGIVASLATLAITQKSIFYGNLATGRGGAISMDTGTPQIAPDTSFTQNNLTGGVTPFEASFGGSLGCSLLAPSSNFTFAPTIQGCPGVVGYPCPVICGPTQVGMEANETVTCSASPTMTVATCVANAGVMQYSWVANNGAANYGVKGVTTPTNVMGARAYATVISGPGYPNLALIFGGIGNDESGGTPYMDDTWLVNTTDTYPTVTWIDGSRVMQPYHASGATANISARYQSLGWIEGTKAYLYGGWEYSSNAMSDMWTLDMNNIRGGWSAATIGGTAGFGVTPVYGTLHTGVASVTTPGFRFRSSTWSMPNQLPGCLLLYGGAGGYADLWSFNVVTGVWTWMGGPTGGGYSTPIQGIIGSSSPQYWPGHRERAKLWMRGTTLVMYGGNGKPGGVLMGYNDLWQATYNAGSMNFTWGWLSGGYGLNAASVRPGTPNTFCFGCVPPPNIFQEVLMSQPLTDAGIYNVFIYGGNDIAGRSHEETWAIAGSAAGYMWVAGNQLGDVPYTPPAYRAPSSPGVPGPRGIAQAWPDYARPGDFYVFGGVTVSGFADNRIYRISTLTSVDILQPSGYIEVEIGLPFSLTVRLQQFASITTIANMSRVAITGARGTTPITVTLLSAGAVNGVILLSLTGSMSGGATSIYTLNVTVNDHWLITNYAVTVRCTSGCSACTGAGLGTVVCTCNNTAGYVMDPATQTCATTCQVGWYKTASACVQCASVCANCSGPLTTAAMCTCNATSNFARNVSTDTCVPCGLTSGNYIAGAGVTAACTTCPSVAHCAGAVTCASSATSRCSLCATTFYLVPGGAGAPDQCLPCSPCSTGEFIATECSPTANNRQCAVCKTCPSGTFESAACRAADAYTDTQCEACTPVLGCATPITCLHANLSLCYRCVPGMYVAGTYPVSQDECYDCSVCQLGTYVVSRCQQGADTICGACDVGCLNCTDRGLSTTTCRACNETLGWGLNIAGTSCVGSCPVGQYMRPGVPSLDGITPSVPAQCTKCTVGCTACTGAGLDTLAADLVSPGVCQVCDEAAGYLLGPFGTMACRVGCPTGYFANTTHSPFYCPSCEGTTCNAGYFRECSDPTNAKCTKCSDGCKTCTGLGLDLHEYCSACDEATGVAAADDGSACVRCASNCTLCSGSPSQCTTCAANYTSPPGCAPLCESAGCIGCLAPDACLLCAPTFTGGDCKTCSGLSQTGSAYPKCVAARQTDVLGTGISLAILLVLGICVTILTLMKPLPVFFTGVDTVKTPSQEIALTVDFILSTRRLRVTIEPPAPIENAMLVGAGILPEGIELVKSQDDKDHYSVNLNMTWKQTVHFLARKMRLSVHANAGGGPVTTLHTLAIPMRSSFDNFLAVFTILLDFIQLSAFGFGSAIQWWGKDPVPSSLHYTLIQLPAIDNLWYIVFWLLVGLAFAWVLVVIILKTGVDRKLNKYSVFQSVSGPVYSVFMPLVGQTLYLPIISTMLGAMSCSRPITQLTSPFTASFDDRIICWEGGHLVYVAVAIVVILIYYPLAVYTNPLWQTISPKLDVRYFPGYLVVSTQIKFVLAVTIQLFSKVAYLPSILLIVLPIPVVVLVMRNPPGIIYSLRWPIAASYASVTWSGIASLVALSYPDFWLSSLVLYVGWGILFGAGILSALRPAKNESESKAVASGGDALRRVLDGVDDDSHGRPTPKAGFDEPVVPLQATTSTVMAAETNDSSLEVPLVASAVGVHVSADTTAVSNAKAGVTDSKSNDALAASSASTSELPLLRGASPNDSTASQTQGLTVAASASTLPEAEKSNGSSKTAPAVGKKAATRATPALK